MKKRILVVEDDDDIRELVSHTLLIEGYAVTAAANGKDALARAKAEYHDLAILDIMLPDIDGLEVCRRLKADAATRRLPVMLLTARSEDVDIVVGLEMGAEDYITKPFSPRVLLARVKAALRRSQADTAAEDVITVGDLVIDSLRHEVRIKGVALELTLTEFNVLKLLAASRGIVFSRYQIVEAVHGEEYIVTDRTVDVQVSGLRKKLGEYGDCVQTVRGVGYRFRE